MGPRYNSREPPIEIVLNEPRKIYTCGDVVSGTVKVDTRSKTTRVAIAFEGKTETRVSRGGGNNRKIYKARIFLFRFASLLWSGDNIETLGTPDDPFVTFPFKFRFPSTVRLSPGYLNFDATTIFESAAGHTLPPTMRANLSTLGEASSYVEYYLQARMADRPHKILTLHLDKKARSILQFSPPYAASPDDGDPDAPDPRLKQSTNAVTRHSHRLRPAFDPAKHGFRSRLKDMLPRAKDPSATFAITTTAPTVVRAGASPLAITLSLTHRDRSPELRQAPPPPVFLRGFRVRLKAHSAIRVPYQGFAGSHDLADNVTDTRNLYQRHFGGSNNNNNAWDRTPPPLLPPDGAHVLIDDLQEGRGRCAVGRLVAPTFKTYGIARTYTLKVKLWVECAGKVFEIDGVGWHPLKVLPWPSARVEEPESRGEAEAAPVVIEEAPPPYQEAPPEAPPYEP